MSGLVDGIEMDEDEGKMVDFFVGSLERTAVGDDNGTLLGGCFDEIWIDGDCSTVAAIPDMDDNEEIMGFLVGSLDRIYTIMDCTG